MTDHIRMRKHLDGILPRPDWPPGITPISFDAVEPRRIHNVLEAAFPGLVAPCPDWYANLVGDAEFDAALCVPAVTANGEVAGFVQCWTSSFVKDLAVAPAHRRRGLGEALMRHAFILFAERGAVHVDLKVQLSETPARRLYERLGMVPATL